MKSNPTTRSSQRGATFLGMLFVGTILAIVAVVAAQVFPTYLEFLAAKDGAEIGGHPLSGHVDFTGTLIERREFDNNLVWRIAVPEAFRRYIFAKGYIAIHGASLTVAEVNRAEGWFEVWLIPETRRATVFEDKRAGDVLNIEIERSTQVVVDTVREAVHESLGRLQPVLEALLKEKGLSLDDFVQAPVVPH